MNTLIKKLEDIMVAITFAEAGEYETAKKVLGEAGIAATEKTTRAEPETA